MDAVGATLAFCPRIENRLALPGRLALIVGGPVERGQGSSPLKNPDPIVKNRILDRANEVETARIGLFQRAASTQGSTFVNHVD